MTSLRVTVNYTRTDTEDKKTSKELARRPESKYRLSFNYRPVEGVSLNLHFNYVGNRWNDSANEDRLDSYTRVDLAASYELAENFQIFLRGENIFNEEYEEVFSYGAPPASFFSGARMVF